MRLSIAQTDRAETLQRQGRLLREIAVILGVEYEHVCLALYGDRADWTPSRAKATEAKPAPVQMAAPDAGRTAEVEGAEPAALDAIRSEPGVTAPPPAKAAPAGAIYRLTDADGAYLDRSGIGMTTYATKAWTGTAEQIDAIKARYARFRNLNPESVE